MTNPGDSDEWWKQYGGAGVSPESGAAGSTPQYPAADQPAYPSTPPPGPSQYPSAPQQPAPPVPPPPYPSDPNQPAAPYPSYQQPQQAYPQGGYTYPVGYQPYGYPPSQGTNGMALAALITSLCGLFTCGLSSIVGIFLGVAALNQINRTGQQGRGMAQAGIWIGVAFIVLFVLYWVFIFVVAAGSA